MKRFSWPVENWPADVSAELREVCRLYSLANPIMDSAHSIEFKGWGRKTWTNRNLLFTLENGDEVLIYHAPIGTMTSSCALRLRWGDPRTKSKQIRVDADVADALAQMSDKDRREFASNAIRTALENAKK